MTDRMPTAEEAAYLAAVQARIDLHPRVNASCMEDRWVESAVGIHWRVADKGREALARYRAEKGDGADA